MHTSGDLVLPLKLRGYDLDHLALAVTVVSTCEPTGLKQTEKESISSNSSMDKAEVTDRHPIFL